MQNNQHLILLSMTFTWMLFITTTSFTPAQAEDTCINYPSIPTAEQALQTARDKAKAEADAEPARKKRHHDEYIEMFTMGGADSIFTNFSACKPNDLFWVPGGSTDISDASFLPEMGSIASKKGWKLVVEYKSGGFYTSLKPACQIAPHFPTTECSNENVPQVIRPGAPTDLPTVEEAMNYSRERQQRKFKSAVEDILTKCQTAVDTIDLAFPNKEIHVDTVFDKPSSGLYESYYDNGNVPVSLVFDAVKNKLAPEWIFEARKYVPSEDSSYDSWDDYKYDLFVKPAKQITN